MPPRNAIVRVHSFNWYVVYSFILFIYSLLEIRHGRLKKDLVLSHFTLVYVVNYQIASYLYLVCVVFRICKTKSF